jgi:hypothetical protein
MQNPNRNKLLVVGAVAFVALAVALGWLWGAKKTRDLESSARGSIVATTALLREALALAPDAPGAQAKIEEHGKAVAQYLAALRREDSDRNRALAEAAELYLVDAQAMLRNQANAVQARGTSAASRRALVAHISHAGGRGAGWIDQALALKGRTERYYFEYRTAMGAFADLLKAHRDTQDKVRAALPAAPLLEAALVDGATQRARQAEEQAAEELERIRQMVVPR